MSDVCPKCGAAKTPYKNSHEYECSSIISRYDGKFYQRPECLERERDQLAKQLEAVKKECEQLKNELEPYRPMTMDEAEAAMESMDAEPLLEEDVQRYVRFASDPAYRAEYLQQRVKDYMHVNRALRTELEVAQEREAKLLDVLKRRIDENGMGFWLNGYFAFKPQFKTVDEAIGELLK